MKTTLKIGATSVVALMAASTVAFAAEKPTLKLGGFAEQKFSVRSMDKTYEDSATAKGYTTVDQRDDVEIYFTGAVKLDNGISIKTWYQLEGGQNNSSSLLGSQADYMDDGGMDISGSFGTIRMGSTDSIVKGMMTGMQPSFALNVGENTRFNVGDHIPKPATVSVGQVTQQDIAGDANHIGWKSPTMNGFTVALGYVPSADGHTPAPGDTASLNHDGLELGVSYSTKMGDAGILLAGGYSTINSPTTNASDDKQWTIGLRVTSGPWAVGLSHQVRETSQTGTAYTDDTWTEVGVKYSMGAHALSAHAVFAERDSSTAADNNDESTVFNVSHSLTLGPGVSWRNTLYLADYNDGSTSATATSNNDGYAFNTGILVNF
jgi:hypothetical protein